MSQFDTDGSGHIQVGGSARFTFDPAQCTHTGIKVCPVCAELTEEEAAAFREHIQRLRDERADLNQGQWNPAVIPRGGNDHALIPIADDDPINQPPNRIYEPEWAKEVEPEVRIRELTFAERLSVEFGDWLSSNGYLDTDYMSVPELVTAFWAERKSRPVGSVGEEQP